MISFFIHINEGGMCKVSIRQVITFFKFNKRAKLYRKYIYNFVRQMALCISLH